LDVPLVALSNQLQRTKISVPSIAILVLRQSGGDITVCSAPHTIEVDQPTSNTNDPKVKVNPPTLEQVTRNTLLQTIVTWAVAIGAALAVLLLVLLWIIRTQIRNRPKRLPPPIAPWIVAGDRIAKARSDYDANKISDAIFYDRLSDAVRAYVGNMYGFDTMELTTEELFSRLKRARTPYEIFEHLERFMSEADLVKFARMTASKEQATASALDAGEIVAEIRASCEPKPRSQPPYERGVA
jgi:hypothetical protein